MNQEVEKTEQYQVAEHALISEVAEIVQYPKVNLADWEALEKTRMACDEAKKALEATPEYKAMEEAWKAVEATPEYKAQKEAEKAVQATPAWKAHKEACEALWAIPEYKAEQEASKANRKATRRINDYDF